jgi:hypothetical protein
VEWGKNINFQGNNYSLCFLFTFYSSDDFITYVNHPAHVNFVSTWLYPNIHDVMAFDYWANTVKNNDVPERNNKPIRHFTFLNYQDSLSVNDKKYIEDSFVKLSSKIKYIRQFEWGSELQILGLNKNFDDAFLLTFKHVSDYYCFQKNPLTGYFFDHIVYPNTDGVLSVDYVVRK